MNIMLSDYARETIKNFDLKIEYIAEIMEPIIERQFNKLMLSRNMIDNQNQPLYTIDEIAKKFKVSKTTIHNWRRRKVIEGNKVGKNRYFTEKEVQKALDWQNWKDDMPDFDFS